MRGGSCSVGELPSGTRNGSARVRQADPLRYSDVCKTQRLTHCATNNALYVNLFERTVHAVSVGLSDEDVIN